MPKKGFLGHIDDSNPLTRQRSPFKNDDPTKSVRVAVPLYNQIRKIAFVKHKRASKIASAIVSYGLPIYKKQNHIK